MNPEAQARAKIVAALQREVPATWTIGSDVEAGRVLYYAVEITPTHRTSHEAWDVAELRRLLHLPPQDAAAPGLVPVLSPTPLHTRETARVYGFEGEPCPVEGTFTMVRNGTCLKCVTCGTTTGCS